MIFSGQTTTTNAPALDNAKTASTLTTNTTITSSSITATITPTTRCPDIQTTRRRAIPAGEPAEAGIEAAKAGVPEAAKAGVPGVGEAAISAIGVGEVIEAAAASASTWRGVLRDRRRAAGKPNREGTREGQNRDLLRLPI